MYNIFFRKEMLYMKDFKIYLIHQNLSNNTVESYQSSVNYYFREFKEINKQNLLAFKAILVDSYKGKTVNLRIKNDNFKASSKAKRRRNSRA